jgi:hypothetical protein
MALLDKLPADYVFTEPDVAIGWKLFGRYFRTKEGISEDEWSLADVCMEAGRIYERTHRYPTLREVVEAQWREHDEWNMRQLDGLSPYVRFSDDDLKDYENRLLAGVETETPFMRFMGKVLELRAETGKYPTVGKVRAVLASSVN